MEKGSYDIYKLVRICRKEMEGREHNHLNGKRPLIKDKVDFYRSQLNMFSFIAADPWHLPPVPAMGPWGSYIIRQVRELVGCGGIEMFLAGSTMVGREVRGDGLGSMGILSSATW